MFGGSNNEVGILNRFFEMVESIADYEVTSEASKDLKIIGQIYRKDMGEFLQFLSDENGKSF